MMLKRVLLNLKDVNMYKCFWRQKQLCLRHFRNSTKSSSQERSIIAYSQKNSTPVKFQQLCNMITNGKTCETEIQLGAYFLQRELPIRMSKLIGDLESLPYGLSGTNSISSVRGIYVTSFNQIVTYPTNEIDKDLVPFIELLRDILRNHRFVAPMMAMGLVEMRRANPSFLDISAQCPFLGQFLNKFFAARLAMRLLMGHLICCQENKDGYRGEIHLDCDFERICKAVITDVTFICDRNYGRTPVIQVRNKLKKQFTYLPGHINVILFELLKNSCRAVCEFHKESKDLPPIQIIIVGGESEVAIKIQDEGGGIPLDQMDKIWLYTYSTARIPEDNWDDKKLVNALKCSLVWHGFPGHKEVTEGGVHHIITNENSDRIGVDLMGGIVDAPMAGFGYGLPIARVYATLFGGTVELKSAHGHGADTYVYLPFINPDVVLPL